MYFATLNDSVSLIFFFFFKLQSVPDVLVSKCVLLTVDPLHVNAHLDILRMAVEHARLFLVCS